MTEQQFRALLDRYLSGKATEKEIYLLDQFFESYRIADDESLPLEIDPRIKDEIHHKILTKVRPITEKSFTWRKIAAALAFLVVFSTLYLFIGSKQTPVPQASFRTHSEETKRGEKSILELPDGTIVNLNSNTTLTYTTSYNKNLREVELKGEAYFQVQPDPSKPFIVKTGEASTQVLGTSFNVMAIEGRPKQITLVEGKVDVKTIKGSSVLVPNQQASIHPLTLEISTAVVDVLEFIQWKDNVLDFRAVALEEAIEKIENWYDVDITLKSQNLSKCIITAQYKDESLENVLKSIQFLLNAKIVYINEREIHISGQRCK